MGKQYIRPVSPTWFLKRGIYTLFMLREISSVFVAIYVLELLCFVQRVAEGEKEMQVFLASLASPGWVVFHIVALAFALLHTITWFNLTPQAMPVRIGEEKVPAVIVAGSNYVLWVIVSIIIGWIILR